jgi:hypothetical protein
MRLLLVMVGLLALGGCASARVNVDLDSCEPRGQIDGIMVGTCRQVKVVN